MNFRKKNPRKISELEKFGVKLQLKFARATCKYLKIIEQKGFTQQITDVQLLMTCYHTDSFCLSSFQIVT